MRMMARAMRRGANPLAKHLQNPPALPQSYLLEPVSAYSPGCGRRYATALQDKREKVVILGSGWAGESTPFFLLTRADKGTYRLCAVTTAGYIKVQAIGDISSILLRLHTSPE